VRKLALASVLALAAPVAAHAQVAFADLGLDLNASNVDFQLVDNLNSAIAACNVKFNLANCGTDAVCQAITNADLNACTNVAEYAYSTASNAEGVHLDATATGTATCTNAGGQTPPTFKHLTIPSVAVTGTAGPPLTSGVTTSAPVTPVPNAPDCPASNWVENITDLSFKSATLTYFEGSQIVSTITCTFNPATQNGPVPASSASCTQ
jgi:hypothetical protein